MIKCRCGGTIRETPLHEWECDSCDHRWSLESSAVEDNANAQ